MMRAAYDAIVLGVGGVGSAALFHLARRGLRVLGIDRFAPPHDRGSSHGHTRIIRQAYFEHPDYVPLVLRSYELWRELEAISGKELLVTTGLLQVGPPQGEVIRGVLASAERHGLAVEPLAAAEVARRFPGFRASEDCAAVFEPAAGVLRVDDCVAAHLAAAQAAGAELWVDSTVNSIERDSGGFRLTTDRRTVAHGARLVVAAGPWAASMLGDLDIPLVVRRKSVYWLGEGIAGASSANGSADRYAASVGCPAFLYETPAGVFYGIPGLDDHPLNRALKVAKHSGGEIVADPAEVDRSFDAADFAEVRRFVGAWLPEAPRTCASFATCLYTMSPDEHFIVGMKPNDPAVALAAGLSGHGFKFTPVLGEILAEISDRFTSQRPMIEFLSPQRFTR
jgi:monomeric sarcosine oxidase